MTTIDEKHSGPLLAGMSSSQCDALCTQLREDLVRSVSKTGGHLAANLGIVELMVAIHQVMDTSQDRLVFDVGHQCYIHKMLTGRGEAMNTIRQFGGLSGFPKPKESVHDAFIAGHASNSVAVAVGMAQARDFLGKDYKVAALIGDGALTGGLAYEGLTNGGPCKGQLLVILNDNGMSITRNVGGVAEHLARQRLKPQYLSFKKFYRRVMNTNFVGRKVYRFTHHLKESLKHTLLPCSMFENMGFTYLGPVNGHNVEALARILRYALELEGPVLLHVRTVKGKGYPPAEKNPDAFHGVAPFDPETGEPQKAAGENFSAVFGRKLLDLANTDKRVCALTAAMSSGTGLEEFAQKLPERFFDVGIEEGGAVSIASGMASQGAIPVFAVYSTFLQRAYDMLLHDMALSGLHVVLGVDRAGLVGEDGETHQGVFDVAYLDSIPGITVWSPSSFAELERTLEEAVLYGRGPVAIRYPRGGEGIYTADSGRERAVVLRPGRDITLVSYSSMINEVLKAAQMLEEQGISPEIIKLNRITPLDPGLVLSSVRRTGALLVAEDCVETGSVGVRLAAALGRVGWRGRLVLCSCGNQFIPHGSVAELKRSLGLDAASLCKRSLEVLRHG